MSIYSDLMLGTVQFGMSYGVNNASGKPSPETVKAILKEAFDHGINALDTAPEYGESEDVIGTALHELGLAGRFRIVTKIPRIPEDQDPGEFMEASLLRSMRRLRTDHLAAALLHVETDSPHLPRLKELCGKGLIGQAGISLNTRANKSYGEEAECLQIPASLLDHRFDDCFGKGDRHCFIRGAYLQGMLLMPLEKIFIPEVAERRKKLELLGIPMAELALRYLFARPGSKSVLTGVENLEQIRENIRIASLPPLSASDCRRVDEIVFPELPEMYVSPFFWPQYKKEHHIS